MPLYFQIDLKAAQKARNLGTPGPWFSTWMRYVQGQPWDYPYVPNPALSYRIDHITSSPPNWRVYTVPAFDPSVHRAYCLIINHLYGPDLVKGWQYCTGVAGYINVYAVPVGFPCSIIIFPALKISGRDEGIGDAHQTP